MDKINQLAEIFTERSATSIPAYRLITTIVTEQISNGVWAAGELVPSENELVAALGLSRMTINRAYRELASAGLLTRVQGLGSFIADARAASPLLGVRNIAQEVRGRGHTYSATVVTLETLEQGNTSQLVPADLGAEVFRSVIIHRENGVAIQREERFVSAAMAPGYIEQDFTALTPNEFLSNTAPITHGTHVVEAIAADTDDAQLLGVKSGDPCLLVTRQTFSHEDLVSVAYLLMPGSRTRLEGSFTTA
ncbi:MAG: UTRA domain-containing protein [Rothia sp. (in: high G+C Gram-positive bacteria)]|nr:UTRA domain-containing protein [Rothia sp. (in: high G+C Gram-positive bacteria)]